MVRLISRQRWGLANLTLTKLFGIDDFPTSKDSGKVLIIIIYCYLIIIIYYYYYYYYGALKDNTVQTTPNKSYLFRVTQTDSVKKKSDRHKLHGW